MSNVDLLREGVIVSERYRLVRRLGSGALGDVWEAAHVALRTDVALKFLREGADSAKVVGRFMREARAASALRGRHVCRVSDVGTHEGLPYLVMELLRGEDLGQLLHDRGRIRVGLACEIARQACEALDEAHGRGIIHRDVKPENIFIEWSASGPNVKLVDFGLATSAVDDPEAQKLTTASSTFGTPLFIAPEQLRSAADADAAADIWSLGVVLFLATSGEYPFPPTDVLSDLLVHILEGPAPALRDVWPAAPPAFAKLVDRCLRHAPEERFASASALAAALAPLAREDARPLSPALDDSLPSFDLPLRPSVDRRVIIAATAAAVVLTLNALDASRPSKPSPVVLAEIPSSRAGEDAPEPTDAGGSPPAHDGGGDAATVAPTPPPKARHPAPTTTARPKPPNPLDDYR